jgi:hypothetical protein
MLVPFSDNHAPNLEMQDDAGHYRRGGEACEKQT